MGFTGITSVIMNYVRKTHEFVQYDFVLCGQVEKSFADELKSFGSKVFIPPCSRVKKPLNYSSWLKKIIKNNGYDVIHVHGNSGTMYFEIHSAKKAGVPVRIAHSHSTSCKYMLAHRALKPLLNRELTHALACSDMAGKWLFRKSYEVLPNGIDVNKFEYLSEIRKEYRRNLRVDDKFVIGHVGYMSSEKNHMYLLRIFEKFVKECTDARLLLIGDGKLRPQIESFISEHNLNKYVQLLGKRSDIAQLYQCMDVFVLPSLFEGLPVTLVEAQTTGLHCIVSDTVTKEVNVTQNIQYIGIGENDIDVWVSELRKSKAMNFERSGWSRYIEKSKFNIDNSINKLLELYRSGNK